MLIKMKTRRYAALAVKGLNTNYLIIYNTLTQCIINMSNWMIILHWAIIIINIAADPTPVDVDHGAHAIESCARNVYSTNYDDFN